MYNFLDDGEFLEVYEMILSSVEDLRAVAVEAVVDIGKAKSAAANAAFDISEAEASLNNTRSKLTEAEKFLNDDGMSALEEATKQQKKQGQQSDNMTAMAQEARLVVERYQLTLHFHHRHRNKVVFCCSFLVF